MGLDVASIVKGAGEAILSPVTNLLQKKEDRKAAHNAAVAALQQAREANAAQVTLATEHLEEIQQAALGNTWKDEYATVTWLLTVNVVVLGCIAAAFGYPQIRTGIVDAMKTLSEILATGDLGTILKWVTIYAIGAAGLTKFLK